MAFASEFKELYTYKVAKTSMSVILTAITMSIWSLLKARTIWLRKTIIPVGIAVEIMKPKRGHLKTISTVTPSLLLTVVFKINTLSTKC